LQAFHVFSHQLAKLGNEWLGNFGSKTLSRLTRRQGCQMVCIFSNQKIPIWVNFRLSCNERSW
jgi:hypothetical protein